jgi:hypothetical protein
VSSVYDSAEGRAAELYRRSFRALPADLAPDDLRLLERYAKARLKLEMEERRMHFGALALVSVLFFILLPHLLAGEFRNLALDALALLLLALIVPYVFVYFSYENRVREMARLYLRLLEATSRLG